MILHVSFPSLQLLIHRVGLKDHRFLEDPLSPQGGQVGQLECPIGHLSYKQSLSFTLIHCRNINSYPCHKNPKVRKYSNGLCSSFQIYYFVCLFVFFFRAAHSAYGGSQPRGLIRAVANGLRHSHSTCKIWAASETYTTAHGNTGSLTCWERPGIKPAISWFLVGFVSAVLWWELHFFFFSSIILDFKLMSHLYFIPRQRQGGSPGGSSGTPLHDFLLQG